MDKYSIKFAGGGKFTIHDEKGKRTIFNAKSSRGLDTVFCSLCKEELGPTSDENIQHQAEYHSCPVKSGA